jgi:hypothetical protein
MARAPDKIALEALDTALAQVLAAVGPEASPTVIRRVRDGLARHAEAIEGARGATDTIAMPRGTFDPSEPKTIGRMVSIALLAQPLMPLRSVKSSYGSGVYAIYYAGDHPLYARIARTETPIYVGKADPADGDASTPREQGAKLTGRLIEHAGTIAAVERYAMETELPEGLSAIRLEDFHCRRLVCATNAQLAAERHLIRTFWPVWNSDTKACWGMSKHGDAAKTRSNKRSPWDVVHPGRPWALDAKLVDKLSVFEIAQRIEKVLDRSPPRVDHAELMEEMLLSFRQDDGIVGAALMETPLGDVEGPTEDEVGGSIDD